MTLEEAQCGIESIEEVKKAMREDIGTGYYDGILDKSGEAHLQFQGFR